MLTCVAASAGLAVGNIAVVGVISRDVVPFVIGPAVGRGPLLPRVVPLESQRHPSPLLSGVPGAGPRV